jgi:hypothetical protein
MPLSGYQARRDGHCRPSLLIPAPGAVDHLPPTRCVSVQVHKGTEPQIRVTVTTTGQVSRTARLNSGGQAACSVKYRM